MAHKNKVMRSINAPGDLLCVDIFRRPDDSFGFEEYRRDPEDGRGWFPVGHHGAKVFITQDAAWQAACDHVRWLADAGRHCTFS